MERTNSDEKTNLGVQTNMNEQNSVTELFNSMSNLIDMFITPDLLSKGLELLQNSEDQTYKNLKFDTIPEELVNEFCEIVKEGSECDHDCAEMDLIKAYSMDNNEMNLYLSEKIFSQTLPQFACERINDYADKVAPFVKKFLLDQLSKEGVTFCNIFLEWTKIVPSVNEMRMKLGI